jgi:hypothetical protein
LVSGKAPLFLFQPFVPGAMCSNIYAASSPSWFTPNVP